MKITLNFRRTRPLFQRLSEQTKATYNNLLQDYILNELSPQFDIEMQTRQWEVPWRSIRWGYGDKREVVPAGKRDINDTGRLMDSKFEQVTRGRYGDNWSVSWLAPHASSVLNGYVTYWGEFAPNSLRGKYIGNEMPGRNWIAAALEQKPLRAYLASNVGRVQGSKVNIGNRPSLTY